jgi:hypothetical protein
LRIEACSGQETRSARRGFIIEISISVDGVVAAKDWVPFAVQLSDALDDLETYDLKSLTGAACADSETATKLEGDFARNTASVRAELLGT